MKRSRDKHEATTRWAAYRDLATAMGVIMTILMLSGNAHAAKFKHDAKAWCKDYRHSHPGIACKAIPARKACSAGFQVARSFGGAINGKSFKTCIPRAAVIQNSSPVMAQPAITVTVPVTAPAASGRYACVPNVRQQVSHLHHKDANKLAAWSVIGSDSSDAGQVLQHKLVVPGKGAWQLIPHQLKDHGERCHIQGIQRLYGGPFAVVDYLASDLNRGSSKVLGIGSGNDCEEHGSDWGGAHLAVVRLGSRTSDPQRPWGTNLEKGKEKTASGADRVVADIAMDAPRYLHFHPSGFQVMGDYLAVAMYGGLADDSIIDFFDMSSPEHPRRIDSMKLTGKHIETLGMTMLHRNDGAYDALLLLGYSQSEKIDFVKVSAVKTARDAIRWWAHPSSTRVKRITWYKNVPNSVIDTKKGDYKNNQTMNLVQECGSKAIYLIATRKTGKAALLGRGEQLLGLYRLNRDFMRQPVLERVAESKLHCNGFCNFAAGSGIYVSPTGKLAMYAANHYANGKGKFDAANQRLESGRQAMIHARWVVLKFAEFW